MPPAATPAAVVDEAPAEPEPWESQEVVCDLLDEIVGLALDQLKEKERRAALVPFVVSAIEQQLAIGLKMFFIDHDIGEPEGAANWAPGEEPVPVPIDAWSRGLRPPVRGLRPRLECPGLRRVLCSEVGGERGGYD